ncbi:MAG TPA: TolC family protein [Candidatus Acidoferrum sp.]|jgi:outer membrane protein TolC|nr:TolC family protein [Candidatus Acidoferrum sp.]
MRFRILLGLVVGATLLASAQSTHPAADTRSLSLRECIDLALSRNLDLRIEHLTADIAGYNLSSAYGPYAPLFSFRARHDYVSQPGDFDPQKINPDFPYVMQNDTLGPTLGGKLPLGLSYNFNAFTREDNARTDFTSDPADAANFPGGIRRTNNYFTGANVTLQQHLLKDFWIDADRELVLVRRKELKMSQQALRFRVMQTMLAVELGYYDLSAAREYVRVQEKTLELRQQFVAETRRRVEVGDLPPLDSEQAETQLQNALTALTAAREAFVAQQNTLKNLLTDNFREWADVDLEPADALLALPAENNRADSFQKALRDRPDLIEARLAVERSDVMVKFRRNQLFPNLDLIGRYGGLGVDPDPGTSVNNALSFRNQEYSYGVVVSVPLSNVGERGSYHASRAAKQITELQLQKAEQEVLVQIADFVNRSQSRFSQVGSTRKARTYAEAALNAEVKKLQNGFSTSFVVLQLQEILTAARTAEVQALADYNKTLAQLAFAEGSMLERNRVTLEVK